MKNYDFNILSPYEFECISRDILSKREGLDFKNFADGRDSGIDLRFCSSTSGTIIVQAKRYKTYPSLLSTLKKEVDKVKRLNPSRYIITTSVDLTANNTDEIKDLFDPYIKSETDIIGKQDLNKLLTQYADIELHYFKLWISSKDVLEAFMNKKVLNQSKFQREQILESAKTYVINPSFGQALDILGNHRYVVISGMPGIGKTTLARMLVFHLLSPKGGYDKFYYIPSNIDDAYNAFDEESKQVFFFDDFMGNTKFMPTEKNFDAKFVDFVRAVQRNPNKLFIVTTREYILRDALNYYSKLDKDAIDIVKCTIDMHDYSRYIKAQILYNHLVDSGVNPDYLREIKRNKNYRVLIDHDNFNPRIIDVIIKNATKYICKPELFMETVNRFFDNPKSVWEDAFKHLTQESREMLEVLASLNPPVMYRDWKEAYRYYYVSTRHNKVMDEILWDDNVKMLSDCFIMTDKVDDDNYVDYHNPGIKDFIISYLESNKGIVFNIINNAFFIEQVYTILHDDSNSYGDINIDKNEYHIIIDAFNRKWNEFKSYQRVIVIKNDNISFLLKERSKQEILYEFNRSFMDLCNNNPGLIEEKVSDDFVYDTVNMKHTMYVLEKCDFNRLKIDTDNCFNYIKDHISSVAECMEFVDLLDTVYSSKSYYKEDEELMDKVDTAFMSEIENCQNDGSELRESMERVKEQLPAWDCSTVDMEISRIEEEFDNYIEKRAIERYDWEQDFADSSNEDEMIDNLFATLVCD